jgi:hypothetical protein
LAIPPAVMEIIRKHEKLMYNFINLEGLEKEGEKDETP